MKSITTRKRRRDTFKFSTDDRLLANVQGRYYGCQVRHRQSQHSIQEYQVHFVDFDINDEWIEERNLIRDTPENRRKYPVETNNGSFGGTSSQMEEDYSYHSNTDDSEFDLSPMPSKRRRVSPREPPIDIDEKLDLSHFEESLHRADSTSKKAQSFVTSTTELVKSGYSARTLFQFVDEWMHFQRHVEDAMTSDGDLIEKVEGLRKALSMHNYELSHYRTCTQDFEKGIRMLREQEVDLSSEIARLQKEKESIQNDIIRFQTSLTYSQSQETNEARAVSNLESCERQCINLLEAYRAVKGELSVTRDVVNQNLACAMAGFEKQWRNWSSEEIALWVKHLDEGRFAGYYETLRGNLSAQGYTGKLLEHVEQSDVFDLGVKHLMHKKTVFRHIRRLVET